MSSIRIQRLNNWSESLTGEELKKLLVECIDSLIDSEDIKFYDDSIAPYWTGNGEYIDGKDYDAD